MPPDRVSRIVQRFGEEDSTVHDRDDKWRCCCAGSAVLDGIEQSRIC